MPPIPVYTPGELLDRRRRAMGDIGPPDAKVLESLLQWSGEPLAPAEGVSRMIADVRARGDDALRDWSRRLDGWTAPATEALLVPDLAVIEAYDQVAAEVVQALEAAAERIRLFHQRQPATSWLVEELGGWRGQLVRPLERVAIYVPRGGPRLVHLLAAAVTANVAGVDEVVLCSPPDANGDLAPALLVAADVAGVDALFRAGHATAIAACAYGTMSVPRADKIVGSAEPFIRLALQQVSGAVGVVDPGGPSDAVVIADESAEVDRLAADTVAYLAGDPCATVAILVLSDAMAARLQAELSMQVQATHQEAALEARAALAITATLVEALALADEYSPARLGLAVRDPWAAAQGVRRAGALYLGSHDSLGLGEHTILPARGMARFASGLSVWDFVRLTNFVGLSTGDAADMRAAADILAGADSAGT